MPTLPKLTSIVLLMLLISPRPSGCRKKNYSSQAPIDLFDELGYNETAAKMSQEARIKKMLIFNNKYYDKTSRPVLNDKDNVSVTLGISLYHIAATEEKFQTITFLLAVRMKWVDEHLKWNPADFNDLDRIMAPSDSIWKPDVRIANSIDYDAEIIDTNIIVSSTGAVLWMTPHAAKVYCTLDMRNFPFDSQSCVIKFFSWTYNGFQIDLTAEAGNPSYFSNDNEEWTVRNITSQRNVGYYACCAEPFPDISFTVHLKREPWFYIFNLIYPSVLIYSVALLGFFLPIQCIGKINLEVTTLLAQVVFIQVIGETMPANPEKLPLLGWFYAATMLLVSVELFSAVVVTNIYYKGKEEEVPYWLFKILFWRRRHELCKSCGQPRMTVYRHDGMTPKMKKKVVGGNKQERQTGFKLRAGRITIADLESKSWSENEPVDCNLSTSTLRQRNESGDAESQRVFRVRSDVTEEMPLNRSPSGHFYETSRQQFFGDDYYWPCADKSLSSPSRALQAKQHHLMNHNQHHQQYPKHGDDHDVGMHAVPPTSTTKWYRTSYGCYHILVSWREAAERLDGYLLWAFVACSACVFTFLFLSAQDDR